MKTLEHSLPEPAHNLAYDEIMLDEMNGERSGPVRRFWESDTNAIDDLASRKYANPEWTQRRP